MAAEEGNKYAEGNDGGRPSDYDPETTPALAAKVCALGATDEELADVLGVCARTVYRWKLDHEEFCQALKAAKAAADDRIERSLYQKASGFYYTEQQAFKLKAGQDKEETEVVDVEKFCPPDTTAGIFWLKNRRSQDWRDKQEVEHEVSKDVAGLLKRISSQPRLGMEEDGD